MQREVDGLGGQRLEGRDVGPAKRRRVDDPWARDKSDPWYGMTKPEGYDEDEDAEEPEEAEEEEASDVPYVFDALPQTAAELEALVDAHAARGGDVALVLERLVAGFTPRLARANLPSYERFCEAVVAAAVAAGDGLWRGDDAEVVQAERLLELRRQGRIDHPAADEAERDRPAPEAPAEHAPRLDARRDLRGNQLLVNQPVAVETSRGDAAGRDVDIP